jgi:hypothetical protein
MADKSGDNSPPDTWKRPVQKVEERQKPNPPATPPKKG